MTPTETMEQCLANTELVAQFDRLNGTNLSRKGGGIELAIDDAAGRTDADMARFAEFVVQCVICPLVLRGAP